eukprot:6200789-Pleurochrysis_carterae.AAC.4
MRYQVGMSYVARARAGAIVTAAVMQLSISVQALRAAPRQARPACPCPVRRGATSRALDLRGTHLAPRVCGAKSTAISFQVKLLLFSRAYCWNSSPTWLQDTGGIGLTNGGQSKAKEAYCCRVAGEGGCTQTPRWRRCRHGGAEDHNKIHVRCSINSCPFHAFHT